MSSLKRMPAGLDHLACALAPPGSVPLLAETHAGSLLTCWRGLRQVGLAPSPVRTHWVTTTNFIGFLGKIHIQRKVNNSFLGQTSACDTAPFVASPTLVQPAVPWGRSFLTARCARSLPALCRSGVRSVLCLRACLAQSADGYARTRTGPISAALPVRGTSPAGVVRWH